MEKKYNIELSDTFLQMKAIYFIMGLWKTKNGNASFLQLFYFFSFVVFILCVITEAITTDDNDESVFLVLTTFIGSRQIYRLYYIIWEQAELLELVYATSVNSTDDYEMFCNADKKLKKWTKIAKYFTITTFTTFIFVTVVPFVKMELIFNIAFPLDYKNDESSFWIAYVFVSWIFLLNGTCFLMVGIVWYMMLNFVVKYEILGNDLKNLGVVRTGEAETNTFTSSHANQELYLHDLTKAIISLEKVNGLLEKFAATFSSLFLLQVVTGSICICGGVYTLAFSSHDDPVQDGFYFVVLIYCFFDTFTLMYLGNEIMLSTDRLSHCLYESKWIEQTQSCKMSMLIITERLKQPQQLIVGKLFPMTLDTFTIIGKRSYTMFNVLQNFRK